MKNPLERGPLMASADGGDGDGGGGGRGSAKEAARTVEALHIDHESIRQILRGRDQAEVAEALAALESLDAEALRKCIVDALDKVLDRDSNIQNQYLIGGEFLDETGKPRGRKILALNVPELVKDSPFLNYLCVKIDDKARGFRKEVGYQAGIQTEIDAGKGEGLSVPRIVELLKKGKNFDEALLMERLPRNEKNNSLQILRSDARKSGMGLFISDDVAGEIAKAYAALHGLGYVHADVNPGNIYLLNVEYKDYLLPAARGKIRPKKVRYIFDADVKLLDFELTTVPGLVDGKPVDPLFEAESNKVEALIDTEALPVRGSVDLDELVEAVDDYQEELAEKKVA